jgi:hypothetical protein
MFGRFERTKPSIFDEPIAKVLTEMNQYGPDSPEYSEMISHLDRLHKMKADERRNRVSPDTVAMICGNLLGILIIVAYEQKHVLVSKGLGFVIRTKEPRI